MPVSGINNTYNLFRITERNKEVYNPAPTKEATPTPAVNRTETARNNTVNTVNAVNTENRNQTEATTQRTQVSTAQKNMRDQTQVANLVNTVQKIPNGMDMVAQALIQGQKGINRLA